MSREHEAVARLHYEEAWTRLLSARRNNDLREVAIAADQLEQAAGNLERALKWKEGFICDHRETVQGICKRCGHTVDVRRESTDGSDY